MTKTSIVVCDRCGIKKGDRASYWTTLEIEADVVMIIDNLRSDEPVDLCPSCMKDFTDFLNAFQVPGQSAKFTSP